MIEMPKKVNVPYAEILIVMVVIIMATYLAVRIPSKKLNAKQISSVLRGIDN